MESKTQTEIAVAVNSIIFTVVAYLVLAVAQSWTGIAVAGPHAVASEPSLYIVVDDDGRPYTFEVVVES